MKRYTGHSAAFLLAAFLAQSANAAGWIDLRDGQPLHGDAEAGAARAAANCVACHRLGDTPVVPTFPIVGGQRAGYIAAALHEYRLGNRPESPMSALAANLSDADIANLSAYFAAQKHPSPAPVEADADSLARGESLYLHGDPAQGIPPCQGCHGPDAGGPQGGAPAQLAWPSLRSQNSAYVVQRLQAYRSGALHDSSNDFIMQGVARTLDDASIQAVADYVSNLR